MEGKKNEIFLGDLVRAVRELGAGDASTVRLIAEVLGFEIEERTPLPMAETVRGEGRMVEPSPVDEAKPERAERDERSQMPSKTGVDEEGLLHVPVDVSTVRSETEELRTDVEPFPPQETAHIEPPALVPLFRPQWTRGILNASLATRAADGPLDVERVAEMLARRESVERFPTLPSQTMRRGAQLLVDKGRAMMPFSRDQAWLLNEIRDVAGDSLVRVLRFVGSPLRGACDKPAPKPWPQYRPPPPGTPVVLVTDLGISRQSATVADRADEKEWLEFAGVVERALCPLVAFVPYGQERWPRSLARRMNIVHWDRSTSVATVGKLARMFSERSRR